MRTKPLRWMLCVAPGLVFWAVALLPGGLAAQATDTPGRDDGDTGVSLFVSYTGHEWEGRVRLMRIGEDFNPEVGFVNRVGYRNLEFNILRHIRTPSVDWLRKVNTHITHFGWWGLDGFLQTRWLHFDA